MNTKQAAEFLGVSPLTLREYRQKTNNKVGPKFIRFGRLVKYDKDDLIEYMDARKESGDETRELDSSR